MSASDVNINQAAQIDLVIGQLTEALYQRHAAMFGKRKRGSNAPTVSEFLETHAGKSASWCRRCYKAYTSSHGGWWLMAMARAGSRASSSRRADPNRPRSSASTRCSRTLDALADAVRRKGMGGRRGDGERLGRHVVLM